MALTPHCGGYKGLLKVGLRCAMSGNRLMEQKRTERNVGGPRGMRRSWVTDKHGR